MNIIVYHGFWHILNVFYLTWKKNFNKNEFWGFDIVVGYLHCAGHFFVKRKDPIYQQKMSIAWLNYARSNEFKVQKSFKLGAIIKMHDSDMENAAHEF